MRLARASSATVGLLLSAVALAAQPPVDTPATPTPTPTPTLAEVLETEPFLEPTPTPTGEPLSFVPDDHLVLEDPVEAPDPDELMGPPSPDDPVARIEGQLTVKDKKGKKKKEKERQEELAGKVPDKAWLSEVCPIEDVAGGTWLDRSQERLGWSVCRATLWFDGLFGDPRAIAERDTTYGYVQPKLDYNEEDGVDPDARFRAKFNLPLADRRFNALLGRNESDDGEERREAGGDGSEQLPESFRDADDDWLVGLGYTPMRGASKRLDFDAGVEVSTPPDFFAQGRYRRHWFLSERDLVRARQTVFWRTDDGFGTRLNLDFERVLNAPYVARWRNAATWAQEIEGVEWFSEITLFQRLGERTALAYQLSADGATDAEVPVKNYAFEVIYRRNILREWLFLELRPGLDWRRHDRMDDREIEPTMSVGLQIDFGDREFE